MTDLKERFRTLDRLPPPDLWADAERRRPGTGRPAPERHRLVTAAVALVVAAAGIALAVQTFRGSEQETSTVAAAENGMIAFSGFDGSTWQVYAVAEDGTSLTQLTTLSDPQIALDPAWSPDGSQIAFVIQNFEGGLTGQADIYIMNADGAAITRLTDGPGSSGHPAWSPDGSRIAFFRWDLGGSEDIYVMDADGTDVLRLTDDRTGDKHPAWSPDGARIVFQGEDQGGNVDVYVMNADGSGSTRLTEGPGFEGEPAWSPDGKQIAFTAWSSEATNLGGISVMDVDGTGVRELTSQPIVAQGAAWSPDGTKIVFMGHPPDSDGEAEAIYVMNADGIGLHELTGLPQQASWPSWQPVLSPAETVEPTPAPTSTEIVGTFEVGVDVRSVVYGEGSVWVAVSDNDGTEGGRIVRIDPETHEVQADIPVEVIPTWEVGGGAMVVADGSLWVTGSLDKPGALDDPGGGVDAAVTGIDASTNEVVQTFNLGGRHGADLTFLNGELWVLLFGDENVDNAMEVVRVNPSTGAVLARIPLVATWAHTVVAADGRLVVYEGGRLSTNVGGHMVMIDPTTTAVAARVEISSEYFEGGPVLWRGQVWTAAEDGFARFDPVSGDLIERSPALDPSRFAFCCGFIEADDRGIWFLGYDGRTGAPERRLDLFDPETGTVTELVEVDEGNPVAMAVAPDGVWILNYEGTLTHLALS